MYFALGIFFLISCSEKKNNFKTNKTPQLLESQNPCPLFRPNSKHLKSVQLQVAGSLFPKYFQLLKSEGSQRSVKYINTEYFQVFWLVSLNLGTPIG